MKAHGEVEALIFYRQRQMRKECLPCDIIPEHEGVYGVWRQKFCAFLASELSEGKRSASLFSRSAHEKRGPLKLELRLRGSQSRFASNGEKKLPVPLRKI
jgi:hypothetical protein